MSQLNDLRDLFADAGESTQDQIDAVQQSTEANAEAIDQLQETIESGGPIETSGPTVQPSAEECDDLAAVIRDNLDCHIVLDGGDYPIKGGVDLHGNDDWSELRIDGNGSRLVPTEGVEYVLRVGGTQSPQQTFDRLSLRDMALVVDPDNGIDAGWGRWWVNEEVHNQNLSIEGQRDYVGTGGDKFGYFCCMTSPSGTGVHRNIDLGDGDTPGGGQFDHAIGVGVESEHVGTNLWLGCYLENWWDNGFYVKDGTGSNILIGCEARNCGGANIRIGETDQVISCRSVWDDERPRTEIQHGTCLDADAADATAVNGLRIIKRTGQNDAVRIRSSANQATYRDLYIENHTSQYALRVSGDGDGVAKVGDSRIVDTGDSTVRGSAVEINRADVVLEDLYVDVSDGGGDRAAVGTIEASEGTIVRGHYLGAGNHSVRVADGTEHLHLDGAKLYDGIYLYSGSNVSVLTIRGSNFFVADSNFPAAAPEDVVGQYDCGINPGGPSPETGSQSGGDSGNASW